jgi:ribosomal protein L19E
MLSFIEEHKQDGINISKKQSAQKKKAAQDSKGQRLGTAKRDRPPKVGFMPGVRFNRFMHRVTGSPLDPLKIPKSLHKHITGNFPRKIGNMVGKFVQWSGRTASS